MRKKTTFDVFKERSVVELDTYLDPEKREADARKQYQRVCAIGHWMFFLGFPQYSFPEDDERKSYSQLIRYLV